jgi:hypothetical protein
MIEYSTQQKRTPDGRRQRTRDEALKEILDRDRHALLIEATAEMKKEAHKRFPSNFPSQPMENRRHTNRNSRGGL